ncbi:MAG: 2-isopropylmalate synthase [Spirochaetaceae bacterium]|nr:MAG: 2-isopropylmalate synthase [Spirochaetaceae bacterium]
MSRIEIFDTTLRDGEQSPGASMTVEQKYEIALQLEKLGVDIIEAGFPVSSPAQFEGCAMISERVRGLKVAALARAVPKDIDQAADAIAKAAHPRLHTFIASSPIHMEHKLKKNPDQVFEMAVAAVKHARNRVAEVEFSPEDATRSDIDFLCRLVEGTIDAGATVINIPDTVGYATPEEMHRFIATLRERVPNIDKAILSVHCHNDLGLAVANTIAAIEAGARQAEVTVNGIGERAGNASLEELVMALTVRHDTLPYTTNVVTQHIYHTSRMLSAMIGFPIARNKAIVGENAFAHEAGIHQDGMLKHRQTYEIMTPATVGRDDSKIVLGRHSGLHGYRKRLEDLGITLNKEELTQTYERFLTVADRKKEVFDEDIFAIISDELGHQVGGVTLEYFNIISGNTAVPTATIRLSEGDDLFEEASTGDGPVDAIFRAIDRALGIETTLEEYTVQAVTPGKQALGEVSVFLRIDGKPYKGTGSSTDILEASARAYVSAVSRYRAIVNPPVNRAKKEAE